MNFFKRAKVSVLRQPGKFLLLLILTFILSTLSVGAVSVNRAISNTETHLRYQMRPLIRFREDALAREEAWEAAGGYWGVEEINGRYVSVAKGPEWPRLYPITVDMVRNIAALPQVAQYHYNTRTHFVTDFNEYLPDGLIIPEGGFGLWCIGRSDATGDDRMTPPYFGCFPESIIHDPLTIFINGTSTNEPLEMREGLIEIVAGQGFSEDSSSGDHFPIIVSSGFAHANGFDIGSEISFTSIIISREPVSTWEEMVSDQRMFEFEIIGLFDVVPHEAENQQWELQRQRNIANQMFTINDANATIQRFEADGERGIARDAREESLIGDRLATGTQVTLLLNDPRDLESFSVDVLNYIPEFWEVINLINSFDAISTTLSTLNQIADGILLGAVGATVLVLGLLIVLFLKDRRHEIGIYLALGEKKKNIIKQILLEVLVTGLIGVTLSIFSGHIISTHLSREMIRTELTPTRASNDEVNPWDIELGDLGFGGYLSLEEMIEIFDTSLNGQTIFFLYFVGFGTILVATLIPIVYLVKIEPKKVLL